MKAADKQTAAKASIIIQSKENALLLLSIEDINQMSNLLSSFYQKTDWLYKKTVHLLNSFHLILTLFNEGSSDKQSSDNHKSRQFLSEYAKMNTLNNACSDDLITVEALKQENKQLISHLKNYSQMNCELYQEYKNNISKQKGVSNVIDIINQIASANQNMKDCLILNPIITDGSRNEKIIRLLEKINELKEKNEVLTAELFKKHSQEKLKLKLMTNNELTLNKVKEYKAKEKKDKNEELNLAQVEIKELIIQINKLKKENTDLNNAITTNNDTITKFISEMDIDYNDIYDLTRLSNDKTTSLFKQYDEDIKYVFNKLNNPLKYNNSTETNSQNLVVQSNEIDICLYPQQFTVFDDISMHLLNIIQGKYSMISSERKTDNSTVDKYRPVIKEIYSKIESISLLVSHQAKKIVAQSKAIDYLSYDNHIDNDSQYNTNTNSNSNNSIIYTRKRHSHINTQPTPSKEKEIKISFLFNHFNDLHKNNNEGITKEEARPERKGRTQRHNSLTSLKTSHMSYCDSNSSELFKATEKKIQDKIKEFKSKISNQSFTNKTIKDYSMFNESKNNNSQINKKYISHTNTNINIDTKTNSNIVHSNNNNNINSDKSNTNNYITINDLPSDHLKASIQNNKNTHFIRSSPNSSNFTQKYENKNKKSSKRLNQCSSMKSIKKADFSTSVYTPYQLNKIQAKYL